MSAQPLKICFLIILLSSLFLQNRTPAIAVSSNWFIENMESQEITHTPKDNLGIVNFERVAECAIGVRDLIRKIGS